MKKKNRPTGQTRHPGVDLKLLKAGDDHADNNHGCIHSVGTITAPRPPILGPGGNRKKPGPVRILPVLSALGADRQYVAAIGILNSQERFEPAETRFYSFNESSPYAAKVRMVEIALKKTLPHYEEAVIYIEAGIADSLDDYLGKWARRDWIRTNDQSLQSREVWEHIHNLKRQFRSVRTLACAAWTKNAQNAAARLKEKANTLLAKGLPAGRPVQDCTRGRFHTPSAAVRITTTAGVHDTDADERPAGRDTHPMRAARLSSKDCIADTGLPGLPPCPPSGTGVHLWTFKAACRCRDHGVSADDAVELISAQFPAD